MSISAYVNFPGTCRQAVLHYASVFGAPEPKIMAFGDLPPNPAAPPLDEAAKKLVMHTELEFEGGKIMFSDVPPGMGLTVGDNVSLIVGFKDRARLEKAWKGLIPGGKVAMELGPQFWSPLYGYVTDKFGLGWQLFLEE